MATSELTLGYWDIRGLAEPIRTLLAYTETPFKQDLFNSFEAWTQKKASANYNFPNLPYLVDGDKTITESEAILVHICLKAGKPELLGKDQDRVEFVQLRNVLNDTHSIITRNCYINKDAESLKTAIEGCVKTNALKMKGLDEIVGKREWLLGYITYLDFILAEFIERSIQMDEELGTSITKEYPNLVAHCKRFLEIPQIQEYRKTDKFKARPHNGHHASWR